MTTPPTHLSGHVHGEEAVEIVARAICAASSDLPWHERTDAQRDMLDTEARAALDALDAAGLLATEQEWGIRTEGGRVLDGARDRAYAERWAAGCTHTNGLTGEVRTGTAVAVSRGVTAWREQA